MRKSFGDATAEETPRETKENKARGNIRGCFHTLVFSMHTCKKDGLCKDSPERSSSRTLEGRNANPRTLLRMESMYIKQSGDDSVVGPTGLLLRRNHMHPGT